MVFFLFLQIIIGSQINATSFNSIFINDNFSIYKYNNYVVFFDSERALIFNEKFEKIFVFNNKGDGPNELSQVINNVFFDEKLNFYINDNFTKILQFNNGFKFENSKKLLNNQFHKVFYNKQKYLATYKRSYNKTFLKIISNNEQINILDHVKSPEEFPSEFISPSEYVFYNQNKDEYYINTNYKFDFKILKMKNLVIEDMPLSKEALNIPQEVNSFEDMFQTLKYRDFDYVKNMSILNGNFSILFKKFERIKKVTNGNVISDKFYDLRLLLYNLDFKKTKLLKIEKHIIKNKEFTNDKLQGFFELNNKIYAAFIYNTEIFIYEINF